MALVLGLVGVTLLALPGLHEQPGNPFLSTMLALAGTALSTWLWFRLLQRAEAGQLSLYLFLVPVFGLLIAMGGFGERLNALQTGGTTLLLAAVGVAVFAGWSGTDQAPNKSGTDSQART